MNKPDNPHFMVEDDIIARNDMREKDALVSENDVHTSKQRRKE